MHIDVDIWFRRLSFLLSLVEKSKTSAIFEEIIKYLDLKDIGEKK